MCRCAWTLFAEAPRLASLGRWLATGSLMGSHDGSKGLPAPADGVLPNNACKAIYLQIFCGNFKFSTSHRFDGTLAVFLNVDLDLA